MAATSLQGDFGSMITRAINEAIERGIAEEMTTVRDRVEARVRAEVGQIATSILSQYSMERFGHELLIRVKIGDDHGRT